MFDQSKLPSRRKLLLSGLGFVSALLPGLGTQVQGFSVSIETAFGSIEDLDRFKLNKKSILGLVQQDQLIQNYISSGRIKYSKLSYHLNKQKWFVTFASREDFRKFNSIVLQIYKKHNVIEDFAKFNINLKYWQV